MHQRLHQWARVLREHGVAALLQAITSAESLPARVLAFTDGERLMTDLRHIAELLHSSATSERLGTTAVTSWLRQRIAAADQEGGEEERTRRLESDAAAVQVLTIHRSKGLEFPIVYCPFLWEPSPSSRDAQPVFFHDPDAGDTRTIDVGLDNAEFERHRVQYMHEQRGEDLRLAYVALTRAKHQAVIWWAASYDSSDSALSRLLWARDDEGNVAPESRMRPSDPAAVARFEALADQAPGCISVERSTLTGLPSMWSGPRPGASELSAARFDRELDLRWRRTSYTDITADAHDARVGSEPEEGVVLDEPDRIEPVARGGDESLPLAGVPAGVEVGTFVHRVFEAAEFDAVDLDAELREQAYTRLSRRSVEIGPLDLLVAGLAAAASTPLGPVAGGLRLRDFSRRDRLDELEFELPLAGGDDPTGRLTLESVAKLLREQLPACDPLAPYAEQLDDPLLRSTVRGYLTGSIDLVLRLPGGRFAIVDYKTNWLGGPGEELTLSHYAPAALAREMRRSHYALQALLYTVALHRYLRWRVPGYDCGRQLAGVLYLFVRGMVPHSDTGIFAWSPPAALVQSLSDLLDTGVPS